MVNTDSGPQAKAIAASKSSPPKASSIVNTDSQATSNLWGSWNNPEHDAELEQQQRPVSPEASPIPSEAVPTSGRPEPKAKPKAHRPEPGFRTYIQMTEAERATRDSPLTQIERYAT